MIQTLVFYSTQENLLIDINLNEKKKIQLICHGICQHATRLNRVQATAPSNCIAWLFSLSVLFYTLTIAVYYIIFFLNPL